MRTPRSKADLVFENQLWENGYNYLAGVDEAGRGPLAGPVVAAAVILPKDFIPLDIDDSKKLSPKKREQLFDYIIKNALTCEVGIIEKEEIDKTNILKATFLAMTSALEVLKIKPDIILVDGNKPIPGIKIPQKPIVNGDGKSVSIASASIIAKVTRDRIMCELDKKYPGYGFAKHKGYGTSFHIEAIKKHGISPVHRISFKPKAFSDGKK